MTERQQYHKLLFRYRRYHRRLQRIDQGDTGSIGRSKDREWLVQALERLHFRLLKLLRKLVLASAAPLVLCALSSTELNAQCAQLLYTQQTGASNPMNGQDVGTFSAPFLIDIDNDGDLDAFSGEGGGTFLYYENTGTVSSPTFVQRTGAANPLNGLSVNSFSTPAFADLDNDGDFDMISGINNGQFAYFENTGTVSAPAFTQRTGAMNPMNGFDIGTYSTPFMVDIDNDGDFDLFAGETSGNFFYFENTGTASSATFTQRTGAQNPMDGENVGTNWSAPTLLDVDLDGDFDLIAGNYLGTFNYYENLGTVSSPSFEERTGSSNPLNGEGGVDDCSAPTFGDLDNDGDLDLLVGLRPGTFDYYELSETMVVATFDIITGSGNPLDGEDVGQRSDPDFVDIDNDGDFDMFSGRSDGFINYYENTGTASAATFVQRTGAANPFNGVDVGARSLVDFVDIDNDGDFDAFIGEGAGIINYFENTGTASAPTFVQRTGASNPFNGVDVGNRSAPELVDIDNDGDFDAFIGEQDGIINYYENTGNASAPTFVQRTGAANPFNGVDIGSNSAPAAIDIDGDGDFDVFIGENAGVFNFYENTGTVSVPTFTLNTGVDDPLDGENVGNDSQPAFVDIDNDLDFDMFAGERTGNFNFFENICPASILPIELVFFKAEVVALSVKLTWQTASEVNNDFFTILRSVDARNWEEIERIKAPEGDSFELLDYETFDASPIFGRSFYRLMQTDFDGQFSFSDIQSVSVIPPNGTISVFPNPVEDVVSLQITTNSSLTQQASFRVFDLQGRILLELDRTLNKGFNAFEIDLTNLQPGVYLLRVAVNKGNAFTNRIIKR